MLTLRKLFLLLAMLSVSLGLAVPSAAAQLHGIEHAATKVASGQHHHHGDDGSVVVHHDNSDDEAGKDREAKGIGHSHASSVVGEIVQADAFTPPLVVLREAQRGDPGARRLDAVDPPPQDRPPRTA